MASTTLTGSQRAIAKMMDPCALMALDLFLWHPNLSGICQSICLTTHYTEAGRYLLPALKKHTSNATLKQFCSVNRVGGLIRLLPSQAPETAVNPAKPPHAVTQGILPYRFYRYTYG
jgi:hypothetical protein